jgi:hypothetical protein
MLWAPDEVVGCIMLAVSLCDVQPYILMFGLVTRNDALMKCYNFKEAPAEFFIIPVYS